MADWQPLAMQFFSPTMQVKQQRPVTGEASVRVVTFHQELTPASQQFYIGFLDGGVLMYNQLDAIASDSTIWLAYF